MQTLENSGGKTFFTAQWTDQEAFFLAEALRGIGFPDPDPETLKIGLQEVRFCRCGPSEVLMEEGGRPRDVYILHKGRARVTRTLSDGRKARIADLGPGAIIGEIALLTGEPRSATVYTTEESELFILTEDEFRFLLDLSSTFRHRIQAIVDERRRAFAQQ